MNYFYTLDICPYFIPARKTLKKKIWRHDKKKDKKKVLDYDC